MSINIETLKAVKRVYAEIPEVHCKGLCQRFCSVIGMSKFEMEVLEEVSGKSARCNDDLSCAYLSDGKCTVYNHRPTVCRSFGAFEGLTCPHGCEPEGGIRSFIDMFKIQTAIDDVANGGMHVGHWTGTEAQVIQDMANHANMTVEQVKAQRKSQAEAMGFTDEDFESMTAVYKNEL